ncbi:HU domain-containing protein [Rhodoflexus sp.]
MDNHIRQLLSEENRLTVPQLGTFATHHITAQILKEEGVILPPRKQVTLDVVEQEDSEHAFQNYVMKTEQIGADEFEANLQAYIHKINEQISLYGIYEIPGVGFLKRDAEGKLFIENNTDYNLLNTSYGLPKLSVHPLQDPPIQKGTAIKDEPVKQTTAHEQPVLAASAKERQEELQEEVAAKSADKIWWLAMIPLIMLFIFLIYLMVDETAQLQFRAWIRGEDQEEIVTVLPQEESVDTNFPTDENTTAVDETDFNSGFDNSSAPDPTPEPEPVRPVVTSPSGNFMVVLGSLSKESAAKKVQKELSKKGIETEIIYNSERNTYRVAVTGLSESAAKSRREELLEVVPGAWVARPNQ